MPGVQLHYIFFIADGAEILYYNKTKFKRFMMLIKLENVLLDLRNDLSNLNLKPPIYDELNNYVELFAS